MPKRKITTRNSRVGEKMLIDEESENEENDCKKFRESVLSRLWDSLPPETKVLDDFGDEHSDATESGLDEGDEISFGETGQLSSFKSEEMQDEFQDESNTEKSRISEDKLYPETGRNTAFESWDVSFDFIQSIIWLKSTIAKLQRVPADDFCTVFRNQWEFSQEIIPREIGNYWNENTEVDLIKNRLFGCNVLEENKRYVIPETDDESETSSQKSLQAGPEHSTINNVAVFDSTENSSYNDSGFNSEKLESSLTSDIIEKAQESLSLAKDRSKPLAATSFEIINRNDSLRKFQSVANAGGITKKSKCETAVLNTESEEGPKLSISSATLNHVLRSSECNKLLVNSVKTILKTLEDEKNDFGCVRNNWHGSVQQEAIEAVVSVIDQLDKEKGSNLCKNEVVETVKRVLDDILYSNEVDKQTIWEHRRLVILELCNSASVCTDIVNHLILQLRKLIPVVKQTNEETMKISAEVMTKSSIIFHSLKLTLDKYRSFSPSLTIITDKQNAGEVIPEVTDLWKRSWRLNKNDCDIFASGSGRLVETSENSREFWIKVLEELMVACTNFWPLVKILAWQCLVVLKLPR